jgi:sec-independent protein translocase protein TatA
MGGVSIWHWIIVGIVVMLLFGRGKVSELMGDVAKGIKAFKKGMSDDETTTVDAARPAEAQRSIEDQRAAAAAVQSPAGERKAS